MEPATHLAPTLDAMVVAGHSFAARGLRVTEIALLAGTITFSPLAKILSM